MSNAPAKSTPPAAAAPVAPAPPNPADDVPPGYDVRMEWITLIPKDLTIGGSSLYGRVDARKDHHPTGNDVYWSRTDRHYWVGRYVEGRMVSHYRLHETLIGPSMMRSA